MQSSVRNDRRAPAGELNTDTVARFFGQHFASGRSGEIAMGAEKK